MHHLMLQFKFMSLPLKTPVQQWQADPEREKLDDLLGKIGQAMSLVMTSSLLKTKNPLKLCFPS